MESYCLATHDVHMHVSTTRLRQSKGFLVGRDEGSEDGNGVVSTHIHKHAQYLNYEETLPGNQKTPIHRNNGSV